MNIHSWQYKFPAHEDPMIAYALQRIKRNYEDVCVVNRQDANRFGGYIDVDTLEVSLNTWGEAEVFQTENVVLNISSTDAGDDGKLVNIEYLQLVDGRLVAGVMEGVALDGTNAVLPVAAARWTRMSSNDAMLGDVYIYRGAAAASGAPADLTMAHCHIPLGEAQSQKVGLSISNDSYFLMFGYWADVESAQNTQSTVRIKVREEGGSFTTIAKRSISMRSGAAHYFKSPLIIRPGSDIIVTAIGSANNSNVTVGYDGVYADIKE